MRKGFMQLSAGYDKISDPDEEFCAKFEETMREGPMKAMKSMGKGFPEFSKFAKGFGMGDMDEEYLELPEG